MFVLGETKLTIWNWRTDGLQLDNPSIEWTKDLDAKKYNYIL
jgi:hypothetical protein